MPLILRLGLAGVFALAAVTKLRDRQGTARSVADFGVPPALVGPATRLLPLVEVLIAIGLLIDPVARLAGTAALSVLVVFTGAMGLLLARGQAPACSCFGQLSSRPIGAPTLVRNLALMVVAASIVATGGQAPGTGDVVTTVTETLSEGA